MVNPLAGRADLAYLSRVVPNVLLGSLAVLSVLLLLWQWLAAVRFPVHRRISRRTYEPPVTLLKPVKGADEATLGCLRSWFTQDYRGPVQILFAAGSADDPACEVVRHLMQLFPEVDAQLMIVDELAGTNAKVAKLAAIEPLARHDVIIVSDADVAVPPDFLANAVAPLEDRRVGLVNCFYRFEGTANLAMRLEAIAVNADFWSQVLQSSTIKPLDFALGAVMVTRREELARIGGFAALRDCLADDYQLGNRISGLGRSIALSPVVVTCRSEAQSWGDVWSHQVRWARTIRVCQPVPYFFSILSNATLWPVLWAILTQLNVATTFAAAAVLVRVVLTWDLERRLAGKNAGLGAVLAPAKDLWGVAVWASAFLGNSVRWRGEDLKLEADGTLVRRGAQISGATGT